MFITFPKNDYHVGRRKKVLGCFIYLFIFIFYMITSEINKVQKIENKEKPKIIKTINVISSKIDKQIFFDVINKIKDKETQRNYLQNLKNLILT